jgi:hypothetical protein
MVATHLKVWSIPALVAAVTSGAALAHALTAPVVIAPPAKDASHARTSAPVRVQFSAPADCVGEQEFLARVLAGTAQKQNAEGGPASVQVDIVRVGAELAGEARITRPGVAAPTSVVAVGTCANIVDQLARLTLQTLGMPSESRAVRDGILPANPYRQWSGPVAESLPRNPYPRLLNDIGPGEPAEQAQPAVERIAARNPYRW